MGLLTDPSSGQGKLTKALLQHYTKLCTLLYLSGLILFCSLAYTPLNLKTYISENALLPGLVTSEFREDTTARTYHDELVDEMKKYDDSIPYPWLLAKMRQIGLDTYTHNFTLNYPLGQSQKFTGKNVYGILRAPRASSTESLVLSVPYRPPVNVNPGTAPSIAIMLAFAKFANRAKYWAKDIIFLITEHEQLGMQAWLEAYHGVACGNQGTLDHGDLRGRAGAIQAAVNLELHETAVTQVDIKVEGLNGQLPNLDLFNLAVRMLSEEGLPHTFKNRANRELRDDFKNWFYSFQTLMAMISTQATGIPNGNHGLYHRFGIEAITLESSHLKGGNKAGFLITGRIIERMFRSLNNLLERFHQSFFFYLLPSSERFISIGLYMPAICLMAGALFIKACAKWCQLQESNNEEKKSSVTAKTAGKELKNISKTGINYLSVSLFFIILHVLGVLIMNSPELITSFTSQYGIPTEYSLFYTFVFFSCISLFSPIIVPFKSCEKSMCFFHILSLLEMGTALVCISMNNFSLAFFCACIYVPLSLSINVRGFLSILMKFLWLLAHPLFVTLLTVQIYTVFMFPREKNEENFYRGLAATQQAIVFSIVDGMIYGNWLFSVVATILVPNWLCFWVVACSNVQQPKSSSTKEKLE